MIRSSKSTESKRRAEAKVISHVRAHCVQRDGPCRVGRNLTLGFLGACGGVPEWAHLGEFRRFKTRKMAPELRHTKEFSLMLCGSHHDAYDAHDFDIDGTTLGAEGALVFTQGAQRFEEPIR